MNLYLVFLFLFLFAFVLLQANRTTSTSYIRVPVNAPSINGMIYNCIVYYTLLCACVCVRVCKCLNCRCVRKCYWQIVCTTLYHFLSLSVVYKEQRFFFLKLSTFSSIYLQAPFKHPLASAFKVSMSQFFLFIFSLTNGFF